ncbi:MAG: glycosyltransferase family 4 protein [Gammaproteobacteria bacterium]|nr:glycosyltransferase family 4 protein [Gammaproteobacteria bacterium]
MNILALCLSPGRGGLELYVCRETHALAEKGHKMYLAVSGRGMLAPETSRHSTGSIFLNPVNRFLPVLSAIKLAGFLKQNDIKVLHIHWSKDLNLAVLAKVFSGLFGHTVCLIYTRHMGITRRKKDVYHRFLYARVDKILAISRQVQEQARDFLPMQDKDIELLYHGVPEGKSVDTDSCESLFEDSKRVRREFNLVLFGRVEQGKGQHVLVNAIDILVKGGADIGALVVGHVMDQAYYDKLTQSVQDRCLQDHISFLDFMENPQAFMPCFDAVVLTTYCETFGLVLIEAMRAGVVVIGTDAGGVPEIIKHEKSGLLFAPGDEKELASCILKLSRDSQFTEQLAKAGKARADEEFSEDRHFSKLENSFLAVCH